MRLPPERRVCDSTITLTVGYMSNRRLLLSLADAGGRLMYTGKDLAELSGYTGRVYSFISSLHALNAHAYIPLTRPSSLASDEVSLYGPAHLVLLRYVEHMRTNNHWTSTSLT
jgi:ATP-binding cassette, subfamily D (ALD), peroxisomal long-chain fatty acid import protein